MYLTAHRLCYLIQVSIRFLHLKTSYFYLRISMYLSYFVVTLAIPYEIDIGVLNYEIHHKIIYQQEHLLTLIVYKNLYFDYKMDQHRLLIEMWVDSPPSLGLL